MNTNSAMILILQKSLSNTKLVPERDFYSKNINKINKAQ